MTIRTRIAELDTTQAAIAEKAGMSTASMSRVMSGLQRPSFDVLCRLAAALDWTLDQTATALQAARDRAEVAQPA